jgi:hypothetical protein
MLPVHSSIGDKYDKSMRELSVRVTDKSYLSIMRGSVQDGDCIILSSKRDEVRGKDCKFKSKRKGLELTKPFYSDPQFHKEY